MEKPATTGAPRALGQEERGKMRGADFLLDFWPAFAVEFDRLVTTLLEEGLGGCGKRKAGLPEKRRSVSLFQQKRKKRRGLRCQRKAIR